jgi:phage terminase large subunit-like protein
VWAGVDVGGERSATALVWATQDLRVGSQTWTGENAVLEVPGAIRQLAASYDLRQVAYDPWRFQAPALELQRDGLPCVEFPQSHARMVPASEGLYAAITEQRLTHDGDATLTRHVLGAVAKSTGRGWRLDKSTRSAQIDAAVALAMAVELAQAPTPDPPRFLGWL